MAAEPAPWALLATAILIAAAGLGPAEAAPPAKSRALAAAPVGDPAPCLIQPTAAASRNYSGQTLRYQNFSRQDLRGASFKGATIIGSTFIYANLAGADFSGATIVQDNLPVDFSFATLDSACFIGTRFQSLTYFTYASMTCAAFDNTSLTANVVFGEDPLEFDPTAPCRTRFRGATMNCEFLAQWAQLDMTGAVIAGCASQIKPGVDFSGAMFGNVVFGAIDLTGSKWQGAVLEGADFSNATLDNATGFGAPSSANPARLSGASFLNASVKNVDFSNAQLYGARFDGANLEASRLQGALLTANAGGVFPVTTAASFIGANLKNVDMSNAKLNSVKFTNANFYGTYAIIGAGPPAKFPCETDTASCPSTRTGFTCGCVSARGADLTKASFIGAFLYGADFGGQATTVNGTDFTGAILVAANFNGATFSIDSQGGSPPTFANAFLQGTDLTGALLNRTPFNGAFVDFRSGGNVMQVLLGGVNTGFRGWSPASLPVCVRTDYSNGATRLPVTTRQTICPDGNSYPNGCGTSGAANSPWKSKVAVGEATTPGFYKNAPTFGVVMQNDPRCNDGKVNPKW